MTSEVTVTLKAGKGHDDPWIVVKSDNAEDAHKALLDVMGWEPDKAGELPLAPTVIAAAQTWRTQASTGDLLGGRFLSEKTGEPIDYGSRPEDVKDSDTPSVPASVAGDQAAVNVRQMIDNATEFKQMKQIWDSYGTTINDFPELLARWKERAKALRDSERKNEQPQGMF